MARTKVLITGGSGLVGHALQKVMPEGIYLSSADHDLTKEAEVIAMYQKYRPEKVVHLAARVGGIQDNMAHQADYLYQNVMMNTNVIHQAYKGGVKKLVAFGSNCAYPDVVKQYPMKEEQLYGGPPAVTNFSYAYAKRLMEVQIRSYRDQFGCNFFSVIPCSVYGPHDRIDEKKGHFIAALLGKIAAAKKAGNNSVNLFGTGEPLRQFIYSEDLARILVDLLEKYDGPGPINIAPAENLSIKQIAQLALKATENESLSLDFDRNAPDGQLRKDLSSEKLKSIIGDYGFTSLIDGLKKTYQWYLESQGGRAWKQ